MYRLLVGDCREILPTIKNEAVDCVIADPPYGQTSLPWDKRVPGWPALVRRILKRTGSLWVFGSARMFLECAGEFEDWKLAQDIVWEKHNGSGFHNDRFRRVHEHAYQFYRDDAPWSGVYKCPQFTNDAKARSVRRKPTPPGHVGRRDSCEYATEDGGPRLQRSVIYARSEHHQAEHPTQKPLDIVRPLIAYSCPPGGIVLDPFAGAGTTGVAALELKCAAVLIEARQDYADIITRRLTPLVR